MKRRSSVNLIIFLAASVVLLALFVLHTQTPKKDELVAEGYNADLSGEVYNNENYAYFEGQNVELPKVAYDIEPVHPVLAATSEQKWIEVDLSDQKLYAWEGDHLYLETLISSGLPGTPTPIGEFNIWIKLRATKMEGGSGKGYYYLPNVPYTMFFSSDTLPSWRGYGIHGTYWHHDFGRTHSHGCVNVPTEIAKQLYEWTSPVVPEGKGMIRADDSNPGTKIVIHE